MSLETIDSLDCSIDHRAASCVYSEIAKYKEIDRLTAMLDSAEACAIGFSAVQSKKGSAAYSRWRAGIVRRVRKLEGVKINTVWDRMSRRSVKR